MKKGNIEVQTQNIFPVIKKWLYSDKDIFLRELTVNACDAITKIKKPIIPNSEKILIYKLAQSSLLTAIIIRPYISAIYLS